MTQTTGGPGSGASDETSTWTTTDGPAGGADAGSTSTGIGAGTSGGGGGREWVGQLQGMIDNLATQASPVLREIGAKAAELAALAGEKAGPIAHRAAEVTEAAGARLAERGRGVAAELRSDEPRSGGGAAEGDVPNAIEPGPAASSAGTMSGTSTVGDPGRPVTRADSLGE